MWQRPSAVILTRQIYFIDWVMRTHARLYARIEYDNRSRYRIVEHWHRWPFADAAGVLRCCRSGTRTVAPASSPSFRPRYTAELPRFDWYSLLAASKRQQFQRRSTKRQLNRHGAWLAAGADAMEVTAPDHRDRGGTCVRDRCVGVTAPITGQATPRQTQVARSAFCCQVFRWEKESRWMITFGVNSSSICRGN